MLDFIYLMLLLPSYGFQTACLIFLPICRYDICIQKNKPCETLGNTHTHTHTHISTYKHIIT